jgi:hypothetical protein
MASHADILSDPVIQALIAEAAVDPDVIGLMLTGSRAVGAATDESDYDLEFIVTDAALDRYAAAGGHPARGSLIPAPRPALDIWHEAPRNLRPETVAPGMPPTWAEAQVLYDRTGETTALIDALRRVPDGQRGAVVSGWYDAYLNGLYRSLKQWRRGNALGGRLEAAQTADALLHLLFGLEATGAPTAAGCTCTWISSHPRAGSPTSCPRSCST